MSSLSRVTLLCSLCAAIFSGSGFAQPPSDSPQTQADGIRARVDSVVAAAYSAAAAQFPCKTKTRGKARIVRWQDVEKCVNYAHDRVDWDALSLQIKSIEEEYGLRRNDMAPIVEASLSAQAIPFHMIYEVKDGDVMIPLSNSLLKFLPENSLVDLPVYDREGTLLGSYVGSYAFERTGGLATASSYKMSSFQYKDLHGALQAPGERFLIDLYGVPWEGAAPRPGFRLPANMLIPKH